MAIERREILPIENNQTIQDSPRLLLEAPEETVIFPTKQLNGSRQAKIWRMMDVEDTLLESMKTHLTQLSQEQKLPLEAIRAEFGVSRKVLRGWMEESGVVWERGGKKSWKIERIARERGIPARDMLMTLRESSTQYAEVADALGVSVSLVTRSFKVYDIPPFSKRKQISS